MRDRGARRRACVAVACGSRGRLLRSDARKQERDDDDALDRDLHTGGPSNPRGSPAGLAAGGYSVPGIGGSVGGLNELGMRKMNCEGTTSSSHDFHVLATSVGFTGGKPSASVRDPADHCIRGGRIGVGSRFNGLRRLTPCSVSITGAGGLSLPATPAYTNNINPGMATASYTYAGDANHYGSSGSKTFQILYSSEPCLGSPGRDVLQPINRDAPSTTSAFKKGSTASQVPGLRFLWTLDWHGGCRDILRIGEEAQRDGFGRTCDRRHRLHDA